MADAARRDHGRRARPRPQPGPQTQFDQCAADVAFFGGSPGGGKSYVLLYVGGKWTQHPAVRAYRAVLFRRTTGELKGGGGLWDKSQTIYRAWDGRPRSSPALDWIFEAGSGRIEDRHRIELRHLQHEADVYDHNGREYDFVGFDELQQFTAQMVWYLYGRLRSVSGVRPHLRATCNPEPGSWLADMLIEGGYIGEDGYARPDRSGVVRWIVRNAETDRLDWYDTEAEARAAHPSGYVELPDGSSEHFDSAAEARTAHPTGRFVYDDEPISFTFILATLDDNRELLRVDPGYRARLRKLSRADRLRLLGERGPDGRDRGGNWKYIPAQGLFFPRDRFRLVNEPPSPITQTVRFWDKAGSPPTAKHPNPDWTRGVRVSICEGGEIYIDDLVSERASPGPILRLMRSTAEDDGVDVVVGIYQDTGGAGKTDVETTKAALEGFTVEVVESWTADTSGEEQRKYRSSRPKRALARAWVSDLGDEETPSKVYMKRADWNEDALLELDAFPSGRFDDIVDAISGARQVLARESALDLIDAMERVGRVR